MRPIIGITIDKNMNDGFYYQKVNNIIILITYWKEITYVWFWQANN